MHGRRTLPLILALPLLLALGQGGCTDSDSPQYAVQGIVQAVRTEDRLRLESFLDYERLAQSYVDEARQRTVAEAGRSGGDTQHELYLGLSLGRGAQVELTRAMIHNRIDQLASQGLTNGQRAALDQIRIGEVRQAGHAAEVEVLLPSGNEIRRLTARLERSGGVWRLVGLAGFEELLN